MLGEYRMLIGVARKLKRPRQQDALLLARTVPTLNEHAVMLIDHFAHATGALGQSCTAPYSASFKPRLWWEAPPPRVTPPIPLPAETTETVWMQACRCLLLGARLLIWDRAIDKKTLHSGKQCWISWDCTQTGTSFYKKAQPSISGHY